MTKVEAIRQLMLQYNGIVTLEILYNEIEAFYPDIKKPKDWKAALRGVLYRDVGKSFKKIDNSTYAIIEYDEKDLLPKSISKGITEKELFTTIRLQQYKFRDMRIKKLKFCPITHISDTRLLVASHIKPWCVSNDAEKLDVYNGFLFSPLYDKLFDRGLITFSKSKKMYISSTLSKSTIMKLNIKEDIYVNLPIMGRENYLEFHNDKIFVK